jgi:SAM-dependent methyltransferase
MYELEDTYWWFLARHRLVGLFLDRYAPSSGGGKRRILDVGCGTGATLSVLGRYGDAWGLDISEQALAACRERGHRQLQQGSAEALPFPDDAFDIVTCLDLLEHVDDERALGEIERVMAPGGVLLITVPAYRILWSEHDEALAHKRRYRAAELRRRVEAAGLRVVKLTYVIAFLFLPILVFRLLQRLKPRTNEQPKTAHILLPRALNSLLIRLLNLESRVARCVGLPFGVSVVCVARKGGG